ncbi:MAG: iron-containing alcohol dehydrogenase [Planctomycetota bacterium]|nr:iron-containing alcohol dehydrogenase [Planctomycetota bacterium]
MPNSFLVPTKVVAGAGSIASVGKETGAFGSRALVVTGRTSARESGALDKCLTSLAAAGIEAAVFDGCDPEPPLAAVDAASETARRHRAEVVVAIGGGSAIDVAKAAAAVPPGESVVPYFRGGKPLRGPGLPLIAVPTTSGTGSEVTPNAVLSDPGTRTKASLRAGDWMFPKVAILDPELTLSCPRDVTVAAGLDALCQAIEALVSQGAGPFTDALALDAAAMIAHSLPRAVEKPSDLKARSDVHYGASMAGMAFASARLGAVHGIAHPLGARYGIPHGLACATLLPHVMRFNAENEEARSKYAVLAGRLSWAPPGALDAEASRMAVEGLLKLMHRLGFEPTLRQWNVSTSDFGAIADASLPSGSMKHNPRAMSREDVIAILESACL